MTQAKKDTTAAKGGAIIAVVYDDVADGNAIGTLQVYRLASLREQLN
jgi:hypothetical protein